MDETDNTNSTMVVEAILALVRALNIQVITEGIENQAQHNALLATGCKIGQGYLMGRPAPIEYWLEPHSINERIRLYLPRSSRCENVRATKCYEHSCAYARSAVNRSS